MNANLVRAPYFVRFGGLVVNLNRIENVFLKAECDERECVEIVLKSGRIILLLEDDARDQARAFFEGADRESRAGMPGSRMTNAGTVDAPEAVKKAT